MKLSSPAAWPLEGSCDLVRILLNKSATADYRSIHLDCRKQQR
jgi:hypothetical protein